MPRSSRLTAPLFGKSSVSKIARIGVAGRGRRVEKEEEDSDPSTRGRARSRSRDKDEDDGDKAENADGEEDAIA